MPPSDQPRPSALHVQERNSAMARLRDGSVHHCTYSVIAEAVDCARGFLCADAERHVRRIGVYNGRVSRLAADRLSYSAFSRRSAHGARDWAVSKVRVTSVRGRVRIVQSTGIRTVQLARRGREDADLTAGKAIPPRPSTYHTSTNVPAVAHDGQHGTLSRPDGSLAPYRISWTAHVAGYDATRPRFCQG